MKNTISVLVFQNNIDSKIDKKNSSAAIKIYKL